MRSPELDTVVQKHPHHRCVEGQDHLHLPSGPILFNASQDNVCLFGLKETVLAHGLLVVHRDPQALLCRAAFQQVGEGV